MRCFFVAALMLVFIAAGCTEDNPRLRDYGTDPGDDGGNDGSNGGGGDEGTDAFGNSGVHGTVLSPAQNFPISGALVYLTQSDPPKIPDHAYHYECDEMGGRPYTLSAADGTWSIGNIAAGTWKIVTRKGNFRRVREITVNENENMELPQDVTSLPRSSTADGLDTVPKMAILLNEWDRSHDLMAKFGMGEVNGTGELIYGTESFDIYNDAVTKNYPHSSTLFNSQDTLNQYHMIFFPCTSTGNNVNFVNTHVDQLRAYVAAGGRIYNSCCTALWTEAPFAPYITFNGNEQPNKFDIGRVSSSDYSTIGSVQDDGLGEWLEMVTTHPRTAVPFTNGYVQIIETVEVDDGNGTEADMGVVKPYTWVTDTSAYAGSPLMVTYNYQSGKVFYSVYETSNTPSATISAQEFVLLYVILEVGVCDNVPPLI